MFTIEFQELLQIDPPDLAFVHLLEALQLCGDLMAIILEGFFDLLQLYSQRRVGRQADFQGLALQNSVLQREYAANTYC